MWRLIRQWLGERSWASPVQSQPDHEGLHGVLRSGRLSPAD
ncbi:MAG TPA: hypothetical protein VFE25_10585 [Opitutaceae bacterium]|nr:hypothetical protein [Opitutaceae bacterium]